MSLFIVPNFLRGIGVDVEKLEAEVGALEEYKIDEPTSKSSSLKFIPGNHPALQGRGNPVARTKLFLQSNTPPDEIRKYWYPYGSYSAWKTTKDISQAPASVQDVIAKSASKCDTENEKLNHNHYIITKYMNGDDFIGSHQDKVKDIASDSWIVVYKFGAARRFNFSTTQDGRPFFSEKVLAGSAIFMSYDMNQRIYHSVPKDDVQETSYSIVSREIHTTIRLDDIKQD